MTKTATATRQACALVVCAAFLSACTTNPFTGERQVSKTAAGAVIGAAAGAGIGALAGRGKTKAILIGAGVGALSGGAVGAYMDIQERKLRERLAGTGVSVTRVGNDIILNMPGNVTFATNSADIQSGFYDVLGSVSLVLDEYKKTVIEIMGHTDSTGEDAYNLALSQRRADSVAAFLRSRGVDGRRILTQGFGEQYPIAPNDTAAGREANRRVEMRLVPLTAS